MNEKMNTNNPKPWWSFGFVWLIIAGPVIVIFACVATIFIAVSKPDPVIDANYYRNGIEINKTLNEQHDGLIPALQGRNHAATGVKPAKP